MRTVQVVVEAVCLSTPGVRVAKAPQDEAYIGPHGLVGDRHEAEFVRSRSGNVRPNDRQWSAVSREEIETLCADIGVAVFAPGSLGENLRLSGVALGEVPEGSVLELPGGARLEVAGQNDPCLNAAHELSQTYGPEVGLYFVKRAFGRRGVIGRVLVPGPVRVGDIGTLLILEGEAQPLRQAQDGALRQAQDAASRQKTSVDDDVVAGLRRFRAGRARPGPAVA